ncbi:MAG: DnaJ domain-containing protein [Acidobacteriota bacterium]
MPVQRDFYAILGVDGQASEEQIRAAFRRLARERHPDRFQGRAKREAEIEFQEITEAYNVLVDPERRSRYDQSLSQTGRETLSNPRDVARALLAKAVGLMKEGDHTRAGEFFSQSVAHDPQNARGRHLYAMFLAQHAGRLDEALRQVDQAAKLDPLNVRILLDASRLFAKAKMIVRATRLAESAAELSPDDPAVESWLQQLRQSSR